MREELVASGAAAEPRALEATDVLRLREVIERQSGLLLDQRKDEALAEAVAEVAARFALGSVAEVLSACDGRAGRGTPFEALVRRLTIGETHFFRNRPHFQALADVVFPELFERRGAERTLSIWSAGCSTGEETYTLAMTLRASAEARGIDLANWDVRLVGTDIDPEALDRARVAEYGRYSFRGVEEAEIARYFEAAGDALRVAKRYRDMAEFRLFNLKTDRLPDPTGFAHDLDLIVCRNVTIYFSSATTRDIADRFFETLAEGGYLLVGHSEHSIETYRRFQTRALPEVVLYQRGGEQLRKEAAGGGLARMPELGALLRRPPHVPAPSARRLRAPDVPATLDAPAPRRGPTLADARLALAEGDLNRAASIAVAVLEEQPDEPDACLLLGQVAADRGRGREADIWLRRTLELRPLDLVTHYLLALLAAERGERARALRYLESAIYVEPDFVMAHYLAARLQREAGNTVGADRSLRTALRILEGLAADAEVPFSQGLTSAQMRGMLRGGGSS